MDDISEVWKDHRKAQQQRRAKRLPSRTESILFLRSKGYKIKSLTAFQFRIDDFLDIYPIHCRYHNIKTGKRGGFNPKKIEELIRKEQDNGKCN